ncbi:MAG: hypothetical protein DGJ47_000200 [Rickettsiaceae bacterium]
MWSYLKKKSKNQKLITDSQSLHHAIIECNHKAVKKLLKDGASVHQKDNDDTSVLCNAIIYGNCKIFKYLVDYGADLTEKLGHGESLLHLAAAAGQKKIIEFLIDDCDFDINKVDRLKETPLYYASNLEVYKLLMAKGANANAINTFGESLLHTAIKNKNTDHIYHILNYERTLVEEEDESDCFIISSIKNLGTSSLTDKANCLDLNSQDLEGNTTLHLSVQIGCNDILNRILKLGANPNITNYKDEYPMDIAIASMILCPSVNKEGLVKSLLFSGARVNQNGKTDHATLMKCLYQTGSEELINCGLANKLLYKNSDKKVRFKLEAPEVFSDSEELDLDFLGGAQQEPLEQDVVYIESEYFNI